MDFTKFMALLINESLYLSRSDKFEDPYEGTFPEENHKYRREKHKNLVPKEQYDFAEKLLIDFMKENKKNTFINCWHMNNYESAAMWKLYANTNESISIETDYETLRDNLPEYVKLGIVDYKKKHISERYIFDAIMHKRMSFEHEKEVRIVFLASPPSNYENFSLVEVNNEIIGLNMKVQLNKIIKKIHISPHADDWFCEVVKNICKKYDIADTPIKSDLYTLK